MRVENTQGKKRFFELDIVRILAAVAVVVVHSYAVVVLGQPLGSKTWWAGDLADSLVRWCVPVFIMLSGALLIRGDTERTNLKRYYAKRLLSPLLILFSWTIMYTLWYAKFQSSAPLMSDIGYALKQLLLGTPIPGHLYYLFIALGLYAVTPFINLIVGYYSLATIARLTVASLFVAGVTSIINMWVLHGSGTTNAFTAALPYAGYYLMGYVLHVNRERIVQKLKTTYAVGLFLLVTGLIAILSYVLWSNGASVYEALYFYEYLSPAVILQSILAMIVLVRFGRFIDRMMSNNEKSEIRYRSIIMKLSDATLGVYLVHVFVQFILSAAYAKFGVHFQNAFISATSMFLLTTFASFTLVVSYKQLTLYRRRITRRIATTLRRPVVVREPQPEPQLSIESP